MADAVARPSDISRRDPASRDGEPSLLPRADTRRRLVIAVVLAVLVISAFVRFYDLSKPSVYVFDEVYYAKDAQTIIDGNIGHKPGYGTWLPGEEIGWPHPEYGKLAIALGILTFGNDAFGWRFMPALAGLLLLACVYPLGRRLGLNRGWALAALVLAAADMLGIVQSRIATLDIFVALWGVLCIYLALRYVQDGHRWYWLLLSGITGGLAVGTKWSGGLAILVAGVLVFLFRKRDPEHADDEWRVRTLRAGRACLLPATFLVLLPAALYVASYTFYFAAGHSLGDWWQLQREAVKFNRSLHATHPYASKAPTWIVDSRPVWYYFKSINGKFHGIVALGNPLLWWGATLALFATPLAALRDRDRRMALPALIVALLYFPWLLTDRTSFLFYMTPVAPFMAILVAVGLQRLVGEPLRLPRTRPSTIENDARSDGRAQHALIAFAFATAVTALLWHQIGVAARWIFWSAPDHASRALAIAATVMGIAVATAGVSWLAVRVRTAALWRPLAWMYVGAVVGIAIVFLPVAIDLPISPKDYYQLMWFNNWI